MGFIEIVIIVALVVWGALAIAFAVKRKGKCCGSCDKCKSFCRKK